MTRLHSFEHCHELAYHAVRHALLDGLPRKRASNGRFVSLIPETAKRLREEHQAQANLPLAEAIEATRSASTIPLTEKQRGRV